MERDLFGSECLALNKNNSWSFVAKRGDEVSLKDMSEEDKRLFEVSDETEWPQPELHSWKAKSRWCIHGHVDPDTGTLCTYSPTPQSEGLMMFLQVYNMKFAFADVKNTFCQSRKLKRPRGPIFAEPCEEIHLPPGALIAVEVPVHGLDDAPAEWRAPSPTSWSPTCPSKGT